MNNLDLTKNFSTFTGEKLLQHTDLLYSIQKKSQFFPITIQLAPTERCESDCSFCSVSDRPFKNYMDWELLTQCLIDFRELGAKSLEITGGGNPLLYRDSKNNKNINDIIEHAAILGYEIGIITNSHKFKILEKELYQFIKWIRVSLIKLDEGYEVDDYDFNDFPTHKLGFSYIIYKGPSQGKVYGKNYAGTSIATIQQIAKLVEKYKEVKFVRIAGDCLIKGNNLEVYNEYKDVIEEIDKYGKFFIKEIKENDSPYNNFCGIGLIRPYVASAPNSNDCKDYRVYICTSHVLQKRNYDLDYALCHVSDLKSRWLNANSDFRDYGYPYGPRGNKGKNWLKTCSHCYYFNNNQLLHTVISDIKDKNFV